jgi:hypothetical protein
VASHDVSATSMKWAFLSLPVARSMYVYAVRLPYGFERYREGKDMPRALKDVRLDTKEARAA